jgi:hypothetical protein
VAIGKRKRAGTIVVRGWRVTPSIPGGSINKVTVIDGIRVLIQRYPNLSRSRNITDLIELPELG